jgi:AAA15 family ATPase/GTPase
MSAPQIRLKTEGFRAINKANIIIDGVTVVAGENSSGKSTLSKSLYYLFKATSQFDSLVRNELENDLQNVFRFVDIALYDLYPVKGDVQRALISNYQILRNNIRKPVEGQIDEWRNLIKGMSHAFIGPVFSSMQEKEWVESGVKRLQSIAQGLLGIENSEIGTTEHLFDKIGEFIASEYREAFETIKNRPNSLFIKSLRNTFSTGELPKVFEVYEFDDEIVSMTKENLGIPYSIQNSIYIDTPMMVGIATFQNNHWDDLNRLLEKRGASSFSDLSNIINNDIISGEVTVTENNAAPIDNFSFKRADGSIFNLLDCATGIKSFAILQLLLKNGSLNDKTLLIIDEPESHLHPQWIIEYARLIVLLNKHAGIKFFIASHNPDMVSAIKFISAKQGIENKLNFYLAEKVGDSYSYNYKELGKEIDQIFASFNISIDRMNKYGV